MAWVAGLGVYRVSLESGAECAGAGITLYWNSACTPWAVIPGSRFVPPGGVPSNAGTLMPALSNAWSIQFDPLGAAQVQFTRPLSLGNACTLVEASTNLRTWQIIDLPATVTRNVGGGESVSLRVLDPPHVHSDGSVHLHNEAAPQRYFRLRLAE